MSGNKQSSSRRTTHNSVIEQRGSQLGSSFAGIGAGTAITAIVGFLPQDSPLRNVVIWLASPAGVMVSIFWYHFERAIRNWTNDRQMATEAKKARALAEKTEANPHTSENHKRAMRAEAERLELLLMEAHTNRVEKIITIDKIEK